MTSITFPFHLPPNQAKEVSLQNCQNVFEHSTGVNMPQLRERGRGVIDDAKRMRYRITKSWCQKNKLKLCGNKLTTNQT